MTASLRIRYPKGLTNQTDIDLKSMSEDKSNVMNNYLQRLVKLIPGEAVTIHMTIQNMVKDVENPPASYQYLPFVGLMVVFIVRVFGTRLETSTSKWNIEWPSVLVATTSYIIWVYATNGEFPFFAVPEDESVWVGVVVILWTFAIPYFYRPKN